MFGQQTTEEILQIEQMLIEANQLRLLEKYDEALSKYEEVVRLDREMGVAYYEMARIHLFLENEVEATNQIKRAIDIEPSNTWYKKFLIQVYQNQGYFQAAADLYRELIKQAPKNEEYYRETADLLVKAKAYDEALKILDDLEKEIGITPEIAKKRHLLHLESGSMRKAQKELEELIEAFPKNVEYRLLLAKFFEQSSNKSAAQKVYEEILAIDPNQQDALLATANNQRKGASSLGIVEKLKPIFEQTDLNIDLKIKQILPQLQDAVDQNDTEMMKGLLELTETLETAHPQDPKGYAASGDLYFYLGDFVNAKEKYAATLKLKGSVYAVWAQYLSILNLEKDYDALSAYSNDAIDLFPNQPMVYIFLGMAENFNKDYNLAFDILEQASWMVKQESLEYALIKANQAISLVGLKKKKDAAEALNQANSVAKDHPEILSLNSYYHLLSGKENEAINAAELALEAGNGDPRLQVHLAFILAELDKLNRSKVAFSSIVEKPGLQLPNILEKYGDILFQLDEQEQAVNWWKKALDAGSKSKLLQKKIAERKFYE